MNAERLGLDTDGLGKSFYMRGAKYTIKGLKTQNRRYPVIAEKGSGGRYKFSVYQIQNVTLTDL